MRRHIPLISRIFLMSLSVLSLYSLGAPAMAATTEAPIKLSRTPQLWPAMRHQGGDLRVHIDTGEDTVQAAYVALRGQSSNQLLMRDANGFFIPWSGKIEVLQDTGARPQKGILTLKILNQNLGDITLPLSLMVAYKTPAGLKQAQWLLLP